MKPLHKKALLAAAEVSGILLAHFVLIHVLAEKDVVATILAAGKHSPPLAVAAAGLFMVVRVLAVLLLPGMVLSHLAALALERWRRGGLETGAGERETVRDEEAQGGA